MISFVGEEGGESSDLTGREKQLGILAGPFSRLRRFESLPYKTQAVLIEKVC